MPFSVRRKITAAVEAWFARAARPLPWRATYDSYHVWVSEVMLQQTRMEVVLRYYDRFINRFPSVSALASSDESDVLAAWSGLGYYRRARMLLDGARDVAVRFDGRIPSTVEELQSIKGIGRYTAGAIASIAFGQHAPIVDGNVARILARLLAIDEPVASAALMRAAWDASSQLVRECKDPRAFNQGLMEIGALICKPQNPRCEECPLLSHCETRGDALPRPRIRKEIVSMTVPLLVISDGKGRLLMRRESGTLMNAMYHLPHGDTKLLTGAPLAASLRTLIGSFRHTVTNRQIEFRVFDAELRDGIRESANEYAWIDPAEIASIPHPSYVTKALRLLHL